MSEAIDRIKSAITSNKICIFMKGNRDFPQCGFSAATIQVFEQLGVPYGTVDVLSDGEVREQVKSFSNWPTRISSRADSCASNISPRWTSSHPTRHLIQL